MAYRILTAAALCVALAAPALADTQTTKSSTSCWRGTCTTETKTTLPDAPSKPNPGYLPNFRGVAEAGGGGSSASQPPISFSPPSTEPVDPKCRAVNACLKFW